MAHRLRDYLLLLHKSIVPGCSLRFPWFPLVSPALPPPAAETATPSDKRRGKGKRQRAHLTPQPTPKIPFRNEERVIAGGGHELCEWGEAKAQGRLKAYFFQLSSKKPSSLTLPSETLSTAQSGSLGVWWALEPER
jgi:hypothetical protein